MIDSYLEGKIKINLGDTYSKKYHTEDKYQSVDDINAWVKRLMGEIPSTYKKFGEITLKVRRVYPSIPEDIYKSDWHKLKIKD